MNKDLAISKIRSDALWAEYETLHLGLADDGADDKRARTLNVDPEINDNDYVQFLGEQLDLAQRRFRRERSELLLRREMRTKSSPQSVIDQFFQIAAKDLAIAGLINTERVFYDAIVEHENREIEGAPAEIVDLPTGVLRVADDSRQLPDPGTLHANEIFAAHTTDGESGSYPDDDTSN